MSDPNSTIALAIPQENGTQRKGYGTTSDELKTTLTESSTGSRNILTYFFLILREIKKKEQAVALSFLEKQTVEFLF